MTNPDAPDLSTFIEPVDFTNDRLSFLDAYGEAYVITDDGGKAHGIFLSYEEAVRAHHGTTAPGDVEIVARVLGEHQEGAASVSGTRTCTCGWRGQAERGQHTAEQVVAALAVRA